MLPPARIVALSAIAALLVMLLAIPAKTMFNWPFALSVMRFKSRTCIEHLSMEGPAGGVHIKQDTCHTWNDGQNFPSFTCSWVRYTPLQHMPKDRDCAVLVYEKDHCKGYLLAVNDKINDPSNLGKLGACWHWDGIPGMSIMVKCREKGTTPDWEAETHWTDAVSTNKHEGELDAQGLPIDPKDKVSWKE